MSWPSHRPQVTIALPVYNGAESVASAVESVLAQTHADLELVISDNASTDGTEEICRHFARADKRVVYQRHARNVGVIKNFRSAAEVATGRYVRWLGDDDAIEPDYVSQTLRVFSEDETRVLVTTQIAYTDAGGAETLHADYDPAAFASADPIERFAEMLRLLTCGFALLDPLYAIMRRDLALLSRQSMLREDENFAARLALAGPWGHVPMPLARRHRSEVPTAELVHLLGVPSWQPLAMDVLQCQDLFKWITRSSLDPAQRRRASAEVLRLYARRKRNTVRRGVAKLDRMVSRSVRPSPIGAR
jgi:glycosyltransferase involved in cell wall biosynthesis